MTRLALHDFDAYFEELHGHGPFRWQRRLVRRILGEREDQDGRDSGWPRVLALPTASGKTACLDVAVFTLACQADAGAERRSAPRRIFFVVDRRVIVDEAHERARGIARMLDGARNGVLARVAASLRR
ncbi:MAG: CRISPR-associated endonuclease Cas3'', partial [Myxococcota bacterium]